MKFKGLLALILVIVIALGGLIFYNVTHINVKAGYVGYMYDRTIKAGDSRAIEGTSVIDEALTGRVSINPITQELYKYPTTIVARSWTSNVEGDPDLDQAFEIGTLEGKNVAMDVYFSVRPNNVGKIIEAFGGRNFDSIVDRDLLGVVKGKIAIISRTVSVYDIQSNSSKIQEQAKELLVTELNDVYGVELVRLEIGSILPSQDIQAKIDQKTEAINAVELAKLDREKQDETNQKVVDEQQANSEKALIERQMSADANAYELEKNANAKVVVAEANMREAEIDLEIAKLAKESELEKQKSYTEAYFKNIELANKALAMKSINSNLQIVVTDGSGSGYGSIFGLNEVMNVIKD